MVRVLGSATASQSRLSPLFALRKRYVVSAKSTTRMA